MGVWLPLLDTMRRAFMDVWHEYKIISMKQTPHLMRAKWKIAWQWLIVLSKLMKRKETRPTHIHFKDSKCVMVKCNPCPQSTHCCLFCFFFFYINRIPRLPDYYLHQSQLHWNRSRLHLSVPGWVCVLYLPSWQLFTHTIQSQYPVDITVRFF